MAGKPPSSAGYRPEDLDLVRRTTLYFATRFGDLLDDLTIAGGFVPSLLVPTPPPDVARHVGTKDLDLGLQLALLDDQGCAALTERLIQAGFRHDLNERGNPRQQAWLVDLTPGVSAVVEFLVPPRSEADRPGRLAHLDQGLAAIVVPGLELVAGDRMRVTIEGLTLFDEPAERDVWVCGPGAFVILRLWPGGCAANPRTSTTSGTSSAATESETTHRWRRMWPPASVRSSRPTGHDKQWLGWPRTSRRWTPSDRRGSRGSSTERAMRCARQTWRARSPACCVSVRGPEGTGGADPALGVPPCIRSAARRGGRSEGPRSRSGNASSAV